MSKVIIYQQDDGTLALRFPNFNCGLTLEQIAAKDVPKGKPYRIIDASDLPADFTFLSAWEADFSNPDGQGADHGAGSLNAVIGWNPDGTPILREEESCQ